MDLKKKIRVIDGWPRNGVKFQDITPLMQDPKAFSFLCQQLVRRYEGEEINKVVGVDSRGFIFASILANRLEKGFVPIRKKNKLPFQTVSKDYQLEYGNATLEIHVDGIDKGDKILIVDDVIATGGTLCASVDLVKELGGKVVECACVLEVVELSGRKKLGSTPLFSLLSC